MSSYGDFIKNKIKLDHRMGFDIDIVDLNPVLKPHQVDICKWAIEGGRRAIFASFGLGKTFMQLEILRIIQAKEGGRQLVIAPLGVRKEFKDDSKKLGIGINFVRWSKDVNGPGIYITNYESVRDGRLDINLFNSCSLDEASCLRSYGSLTFQTFLALFTSIKYRFVATALPSPNRLKELIHYAGFLGVMDTGQALTRFFKRNSTKANQLTLYPHKEKEFWMWVASWAVFLQKPSDLGYPDTGYDLPALNIHYKEVHAESEPFCDRDGQLAMFNDAAISLPSAAKEKRESITLRTSEMVDIVSDFDGQFIVWCDLDAEQKSIEKALRAAKISFVSLYGNTDIDTRETLIGKWKDKEVRAFVSKPTMYGSGINMQQCNVEIFLGVNFKANDFLQAIHRIYRFQQDRECHIYVIYMDTEKGILAALKRKWGMHEDMVGNMVKIIKKYGLSAKEMELELQRSVGVDRIEYSGERFNIINNDAVIECRDMAENSTDLIISSIPFANHYEYTPSYLDFGHSESNDHFWEQMDFLTPELYRILSPGRICCIHVKDRILFGNVTGLGFPTSDNMHEETSFHFQKHGFKKIGMITIVTDVVRENNQTYRLGWTEQCKDGSKMGVGCPEYVLIFRKPQTVLTKGYADNPVVKSKKDYTRAKWQIDAHAFWRSSGNRLPTIEDMACMKPDELSKVFENFSLSSIYDYDFHVKLGEKLDLKGRLPVKFMSLAPGSHQDYVWHDIVRMNTLNSNQARRDVQLHLCPLQIDVVKRLIERFSSEGEEVFDMFAGIGTVPYLAVKMGRVGRGIELNHDYAQDAARYCRIAEAEATAPTMFDFMEMSKIAIPN